MRAVSRLPRSPQILALIGASFVIALGFGIVSPALPEFARTFGVGIDAASAIVSAFAGMRLLFAPVSGALVQRLGERRTYLTGLLIVAASTAACAFAADYWQLLIFRGLGGIGSVMFTVSALGLLIRLSPPAARGRVAALYSGSFLVGGVAGPLAGAALVVLGLRIPFLVYAAALLVAATIVFLVVREQEGQDPAGALETASTGTAGGDPAPSPAASPAVAEASGAERLRLRDALRSPLYLATVAASFATGWAVFGVRPALVPLLLTDGMQRPAADAALALAAFALGNAAVLTFSGRLSDRHGRKPFLLAGLLLGAVATGLTGFAGIDGGFVPLLALMLLAGALSGLMSPAQQAALADAVGSRARGGIAVAGYQMASDLGAVLGPLVAGALVHGAGSGASGEGGAAGSDTAGYAGAFLSAGIVLGAAGLAWLFAPNSGARREAVR